MERNLMPYSLHLNIKIALLTKGFCLNFSTAWRICPVTFEGSAKSQKHRWTNDPQTLASLGGQAKGRGGTTCKYEKDPGTLSISCAGASLEARKACQNLQNYRGRVVLLGDSVKDDCGFQPVFTMRGASDSQMLPKCWTQYPDDLEWQAKQTMQFPAQTQVQMAETSRPGRFPDTEYPQVWKRLPARRQANWDNLDDPVIPLKETCTAIPWQDYCGYEPWRWFFFFERRLFTAKHSYHAHRNKFERFRGFLKLISRFKFDFRRRENFFLNDPNFWCVRGSITCNVTENVHVLWPVCTHTIPFRMLLCPWWFMMKIYNTYREPPNPPDELAQNVSKKNPSRTNYFLFFHRKFRILPCFQLFTWFEFDFSVRGNWFRMCFRPHGMSVYVCVSPCVVFVVTCSAFLSYLLYHYIIYMCLWRCMCMYRGEKIEEERRWKR